MLSWVLSNPINQFQHHMASGSDEPPEKGVKCEACGRQGQTKNWLWNHLKGPACPCLALLGYDNDLKGYQKDYKNQERRLHYQEHRDEETARKRREVTKISLHFPTVQICHRLLLFQYAADLEKQQQRKRKEYAADPDRERERKREDYEAHPERERERKRGDYESSSERERQRKREKYEANPEKERERKRKEYEANPERE